MFLTWPPADRNGFGVFASELRNPRWATPLGVCKFAEYSPLKNGLPKEVQNKKTVGTRMIMKLNNENYHENNNANTMVLIGKKTP